MMKIRLSVLIATVLLGAPLASHADVPSVLNQGAPVAQMSDAGTSANRTESPEMSPHMSVERPHAAAASNWIDSRMAREWWKDN
jgi:hypothetical protein